MKRLLLLAALLLPALLSCGDDGETDNWIVTNYTSEDLTVCVGESSVQVAAGGSEKLYGAGKAGSAVSVAENELLADGEHYAYYTSVNSSGDWWIKLSVWATLVLTYEVKNDAAVAVCVWDGDEQLVDSDDEAVSIAAGGTDELVFYEAEPVLRFLDEAGEYEYAYTQNYDSDGGVYYVRVY